MDINVYLFIVIALMLLIIMYLLFVLRRVRTQLALIKDALDDIKGGNLNRRILAGENDMTKTICYDINKIAVNSQAQLIRQRQSEQAYKRLMTSNQRTDCRQAHKGSESSQRAARRIAAYRH